jgi:hypothetical protein
VDTNFFRSRLQSRISGKRYTSSSLDQLAVKFYD